MDFFFISKTQNIFYFIKENHKIESLSCKYIQSIEFICVMIIQNKLHKVFIEYDPAKIPTSDRFKTISNEDDTPKPYDKIILFDTKNTNTKIACGKKLEKIECKIYNIGKTDDNKSKLIPLDDIKLDFENFELNEKNCYITVFNSEYLFCCGENDCIRCFRMNYDNFEIKKVFKITVSGENTNISIKNHNNFVKVFFMNKNQEHFKLCEYYIFIPHCVNETFYLIDRLNEYIYIDHQ